MRWVLDLQVCLFKVSRLQAFCCWGKSGLLCAWSSSSALVPFPSLSPQQEREMFRADTCTHSLSPAATIKNSRVLVINPRADELPSSTTTKKKKTAECQSDDSRSRCFLLRIQKKTSERRLQAWEGLMPPSSPLIRRKESAERWMNVPTIHPSLKVSHLNRKQSIRRVGCRWFVAAAEFKDGFRISSRMKKKQFSMINLNFNLLIFLHKLKIVLRLQFRDEFTKNIQLLPWLDGIYSKCSSTSFTASLKSGRRPKKDPFCTSCSLALLVRAHTCGQSFIKIDHRNPKSSWDTLQKERKGDCQGKQK